MTPDDPTHISAVRQSIEGACYQQCTVTVATKSPKSGGVAFKVTRGTATFWLQAKRGRETRFGAIKYAVRNHRGVDVGPICHVRGHHPLYEAAEHLAMHLEWEVPRERPPAPDWLIENMERIHAKAYAAAQVRVAAERAAS